MAGRINYKAIDNLAPGHVKDDFYDLDFHQTKLNNKNEFTKEVAVSMGGRQETLFTRSIATWDIEASYLKKSELDDWKEFIFSVKIGEVFTYYPDNSDLATSFIVTLDTPRYAPSRTGTDDDLFSFSLILREDK